MQQIPMQAIPNQILIAVLEQQSTQINLRQRRTGLFMDVFLNNSPIVSGVIAENQKLIVRNAYLGYLGDFYFLDLTGQRIDLVDYTGLGTRWILLYMSEAELQLTGLVY